MNPAPIHLDAHYMETTIHGQRLVPSLYTGGLVGGMIVNGLTLGTTLGNLGYTKFDFPKPVFHGDTIRAETTILDKRESKSPHRLGHRLLRAPRHQPARRDRPHRPSRRPHAQSAPSPATERPAGGWRLSGWDQPTEHPLLPGPPRP